MRRFLFLFVILFSARLIAADAPTCRGTPIAVCSGGSAAGDVQIKPQAVPTSATSVTTNDAYLRMVTVTNTTAVALTFTLADAQATPVALLSAVSIAANTTYVIVFPARYWCPGGFTVTASGAGMTFYAAWTQ